MSNFDLVIRNGELIDGTGAPRRRADIGIRGNRITAIDDELHCDNEFEAKGLVVAPGFVDVHTHDDTALIANPGMAMKASQGVTTVICGNCGASPAPCTRAVPGELMGIIVKNPAHYKNSFGAFAELVSAARPAVNSAFLIGHSTLRFSAMGMDLKRPASKSETAVMRELLDVSLREGAIGMSSGLYYPQATAATTDEVAEVAGALSAWNGIYTTHMRDESDHVLESLDETFEIGRRAGARVVISHHKCTGKQNFGRMKETLPKIDHAKQTQDITFDVYPYVAGSTVLRKDAVKTSQRVMITWSDAAPEMRGRDLDEIAKEWNVAPEDAVDRLQPAGAIYFMMDERDVQAALRHPSAMIGSDGLPFDDHPHPRLWGTFPRVLGRYARELKLFSLEEAVRRMTSLPAKTFGLTARGIVKTGNYADLCIFDPETVIDTATFDAPISPSKGIALTLVNGHTAWNGGAAHQAAGRVLLRHDLAEEANSFAA